MDKQKQLQGRGGGARSQSPLCRPQKTSTVPLHLFGLFSLLFVVALEATTAVAAKVVSSAGVGPGRASNHSSASVSLRNIEDENGKQLGIHLQLPFTPAHVFCVLFDTFE